MLNGWEVVLVLLHGGNPWNIVECHYLHAEILVIFDLLDLDKERRQVGSGNIVDVCDKVCGCELCGVISKVLLICDMRARTYPVHVCG